MTTTDLPTTPRTAGPGRMGRRVVLFLGTLLPGLLALAAVVGAVSGTEGGIHRVHDVVHAAWLGLLVCVPYALQWRRPETRVALWQGLAVGAALVVAGGASAQVADPVFYAVFVLLAFFSWRTHPTRGELLLPGLGVSPVLAPMAAVAVTAAVLYAVDQLALQRDAASDPHGELTHYASQAIAALTAAGFAAVASLRSQGWLWAGSLAAATAATWGAASIMAPDLTGAVGVGAGAALLAGSAAWLLGLMWEHRRG